MCGGKQRLTYDFFHRWYMMQQSTSARGTEITMAAVPIMQLLLTSRGQTKLAVPGALEALEDLSLSVPAGAVQKVGTACARLLSWQHGAVPRALLPAVLVPGGRSQPWGQGVPVNTTPGQEESLGGTAT